MARSSKTASDEPYAWQEEDHANPTLGGRSDRLLLCVECWFTVAPASPLCNCSHALLVDWIIRNISCLGSCTAALCTGHWRHATPGALQIQHRVWASDCGRLPPHVREFLASMARSAQVYQPVGLSVFGRIEGLSVFASIADQIPCSLF